MKSIYSVLLSIILCASANAADWKWSGYVSIYKIYPTSGGLSFFPNYKDNSVSSCDDGQRFTLPLSALNYEVKASSLISAFMANKKVTIAYDRKQVKSCSAIVDRFIVAN